MKYYVLIQNTHQVREIGEFSSLIEADEYTHDYADTITHGERWIVVSEEGLKNLRENMV